MTKNHPLFLTSLLILMAVPSIWAGPQLEFDPKSLDFGKMKQGSELRKMLTLRNIGDEALEISQVRASCTECLVDKIEKSSIPPGEQIQLPVTYSATALPGKQTAHITFHSNDADEPLKRVNLDIEITKPGAKPKIHIQPEMIEMGIMELGKAVALPIVIQNIGDGDLVISEYVCGPALVAPPVPAQPVASDAQANLEFQVNPVKPGVFRSQISIISNDAERRVLTLMVTGYIASQKEIAALVKGLIVRPEWSQDGEHVSNLVFLNHGNEEFMVSLAGEENRMIAPGGEMRLSPKSAASAASQQEKDPVFTITVTRPAPAPEEN